MANKDFKVKNGLDIQSPLPVSMGGTGQTSTTNSLNSLLPSQAGNTNKVLATDGTNTTWVAQATAYQRGGTASRPQSPTAGDLYYNTDTNIFEQYTSLGWFAIAVAPGTPTGVTATNQPSGRAFNNGQMSVAFTPNTSAGAPSSFVVTPTPTTSPSTFTGTSSPISVTGLASSTQYTYTVSASSAYGTSAASSASTGVTATTVPQAPTIGTPTQDTATSISVPFTAGGTGGASITGYTVTSSPGSITGTGSSSPIVVSGLTTGTSYTFTVTATNLNGTSAASSASSSVIAENPFPNTDTFALISHQSLSSDQASVTFNNLNPKYTDLYLIVNARTNNGSAKDQLLIQMNSDTTASNYSSGYNMWDGNNSGGSFIGTRTVTTPGIRFAGLAGSSATGTVRGALEIDFLNFSSSSSNKTVIGEGGMTDINGSNPHGTVGSFAGSWYNTNACNSVTLKPATGTNFSSNSTFTLYGVTRNGGYGS
jgi:hypothetical protein